MVTDKQSSSRNKNSKHTKRFFKILKWCVILFLGYQIITIVYFGYSSLDERTGICKFYWSGIDDLGSKTKASGFLINEPYPTYLDGIDGPYIFGDKVFYVNSKSELVKHNLDSSRTIRVKTGFKALPAFTVKLKTQYRPAADQYEKPSKIIAISDIEGNFSGLYSFLVSNKVIDTNANWIFDTGHLVLNGDLFDRGSKVTPILWLIYHLEVQAKKHGGQVHFILGNHDLLNLSGNASDADPKYKEVAKQISGKSSWEEAIRYLYGPNSELGKWLRTKNIIEKIGVNIFVHGGLNKMHLDHAFKLEEMNLIARRCIGMPTEQLKQLNSETKLITSPLISPYWDRRLNLNWKVKIAYLMKGILVKKTSQEDLDRLLQLYNGKHLIIGHSPVEDIMTSYDNKVIHLDVMHSTTPNSGKTKGLLIQQGQYFKINDRHQKQRLL